MDTSTGSRLPRRQVFLFLIAILIPCLVLVVMGLRLMEQERQLEDKRRSDERELLVVRVREEFLAALDQMRLQELTRAAVSVDSENASGHRQGAVAFVAAMVDGSLRLPWEDDPRAQRFKALIDESSFRTTISVAEHNELVVHEYARAAGLYETAIAAARQPAQQAYAQLLRARALGRLGRTSDSRSAYAAVLPTPTDVVDEHGVPLALYAAPPLLQASLRQPEILAQIRRTLDGGRWVSPLALYLVRDLLRTLDAPDVKARLAILLHESERAVALQRDAPRVLAGVNRGTPRWVTHGDPAWLASVNPSPGRPDGLVVVVRARELLASLSTVGRPLRLATATEAAGEALAEDLPGLRVMLPTQEAPAGRSRQTFLASGLMLALTFTLLAGYLLWRDVQRDLRLAEMRSQFVASVTHELKTPLAAIRMFTETLQLDQDVDPRVRSEYFETILHESERLSRLVDNVLDFGNIERGKKIYRFQQVRLDDVVEGAARAMRYPLAQAGFALDVELERGLPPVAADTDALQQAILNLLTNAMKYSGGSRRIRLGLDRQNGDARIQVADQGIGIAPADQDHVLERFYRARTSDNANIPGTGLGLTLVAHIVAAHGGAVDIDSRLGEGSTFSIRLPLADRDRAMQTMSNL